MYERDVPQQQWLEAFIADVGGVAGTVHVRRDCDLYLVADHNIPAPVIDVVTHVAEGKGMAGMAQVSKAPVQSCNLQSDDAGGGVRPGARAVGAGAAIALPVIDEEGAVRAVVGVAWKTVGEIGPAKQSSLMALAAGLPRPTTGVTLSVNGLTEEHR